MQIWLVIALSVLISLSFFFFSSVKIDNEVIELTPSQYQSEVIGKPHMIVDVREPFEYKAGHIEGAVNIPLSVLANDYKKIPNDRRIVLVCRSGNRSMRALSFLKSQGYDDLVNLRGGMASWIKR